MKQNCEKKKLSYTTDGLHFYINDTPISEKEYERELTYQTKICKKCYGKGYSTEFKGKTKTLKDFIGDRTVVIDNGGIKIKLCDCDRGKDLAKYFNIKKSYNKII